MKIHNFEQGTEEWFEVRKLKLTASDATAIGNKGAGLETLVKKKIRELIIKSDDNFTNKHIERGNELEPIARAAYEFEYNVEVVEVGFIEHNEYSGCSPDGLVGDDGGIEIKARNDEKHFDFILGAEIDYGTIWQIQMNLLITKRKWWDFISYNPNFKKSMVVIRVYPDEVKQKKLTEGIEYGAKRLKELLENNNVKSELK